MPRTGTAKEGNTHSTPEELRTAGRRSSDWLHRFGYYPYPWLWSSLKFMFDK
jgi:hypothetical protein